MGFFFFFPGSPLLPNFCPFCRGAGSQGAKPFVPVFFPKSSGQSHCNFSQKKNGLPPFRGAGFPLRRLRGHEVLTQLFFLLFSSARTPALPFFIGRYPAWNFTPPHTAFALHVPFVCTLFRIPRSVRGQAMLVGFQPSVFFFAPSSVPASGPSFTL